MMAKMERIKKISHGKRTSCSIAYLKLLLVMLLLLRGKQGSIRRPWSHEFWSWTSWHVGTTLAKRWPDRVSRRRWVWPRSWRRAVRPMRPIWWSVLLISWVHRWIAGCALTSNHTPIWSSDLGANRVTCRKDTWGSSLKMS